jgi:alpha-2-macroglobulin
MRGYLLLYICLFFSSAALSQDLKTLQRKSHQTFVYRIPADSTEKYIFKDSIPINVYISREPDYVFFRQFINIDSLPKGHYLLISVDDNMIKTTIEVNTDLVVYNINNEKFIQLATRDKHGNTVSNPKGWINKKPLTYIKSSGTFKVPYSPKEDAIIKICTEKDTVFLNLEVDNDAYESTAKQRWKIFKRTTLGKVIVFLPQKLSAVFKKQRYRYKGRPVGKGFIVFNQPKYKLGDTVKLKGYIINKRNRRHSKNTKLYLEYYSRGKQLTQFLAPVPSDTKGTYLYEFILRDTLDNDIRYTTSFYDKKERKLISNWFKVEDYVPDEISSYSVRSAKENYYINDSLVFFGSAKDANGLNLLDANARLVLLAGKVHSWNKDSVVIADTLFTEERKLNTQDDTRFAVSTAGFPDAQMTLSAKVIFRNSNNELQEQSVNIEYSAGKKELVLRQVLDTIIAEYRVNGLVVPAKGIVGVDGEKLFTEKEIAYPAKLKIDPLADTYWFDVTNDTSISEFIDIERNYNPVLNQLSNADTLGFKLINSYGVPIFYSVMNGDHVVAVGESDSSLLEWSMIERNPRKAYRVKWQYYWAGEERNGEEFIGHLYKKIKIDITSSKTIFPGQKDTITVAVKDYKNREIRGVNLTAFSYNSQLTKDFNLPYPPQIAKYKLRPGIRRDTYENDEAYISKNYYLGYHQGWRNKFGLDTMLYYRMLFPTGGYFQQSTTLNDFYPQVSIHVVQKGIPQALYLLYLNRNLVYYNGVTDKKNYAFLTPGGYTQVAFRLFDKYVEIDSIYVQPHYKHDIVFDLDHLPPQTKIKKSPPQFTAVERQELESSLWQFRGTNNAGNGYVWQNGTAVKINDGYNHIIGPFQKFDSLHYFSPGKFDLHFIFEPGFQYQLSPKTSRLEKMKVFPNTDKPLKLPYLTGAKWLLGDTVLPPPAILYPEIVIPKYLKYDDKFSTTYTNNTAGTGGLIFRLSKDTSLSYVVLKPGHDTLKAIVLYGHIRSINKLPPGDYTLLLVRSDFKAIEVLLTIRSSHTTYIKINGLGFSANTIVDQLIEEANKPVELHPSKSLEKKASPLTAAELKGDAMIAGKVVDGRGKKPVPGAVVAIRGATYSTVTSADGSFVLPIKEGKYVIIVSSVGYSVREMAVTASGLASDLIIYMEINNDELDEVVVTGYSTQRKSMLSGAVSRVSGHEFDKELQGKVSGLAFQPGAANMIRIRGASSVTPGNNPLYVVDGIIYEELPKNISPGDIESVETLQDAAATSLYGSRGANGVVLITTKTKTLRTQFRDYAFWQPQLFTDEDGKAKFAVTYPDNITAWQTYVIGIDKKNRSGMSATLTQAFKPVMAQLSIPQFAIQGDSLVLIAKTLNYTKDKYNVSAKLSLENLQLNQWNFELAPAASEINQYAIVAGDDSLKLQYTISTNTSFKDGEERKVPVFPKGAEEATGDFYILQTDTTVNFTANNDATVTLYVQNNTIDLLLNELEHLQEYPYYCMEQIASKLKGYVLEQQVRQTLKQEFKHRKQMLRLLDKLQKAQLYDGGWSWWEKGNSNLYITNYVLQSLLALRKEPLVEQSLRNGLLYLQNILHKLEKEQLLYSIATMVEAGHVFDYRPHLSRIDFDSLSLHGRWSYVQIKQLLKQDYTRELQYLLEKRINTVLGGTFWGEETWLWYNNNKATTVLAFSVLQRDPQYQFILPSIIQYFLETRTGGHWRNTVESSSIPAAILPEILKQHKNFTVPATIAVTGDTSFNITAFPFKHSFHHNTKNLQLNKTGGGLTYLTLYQEWWNKNPVAVEEKFVVSTSFQNAGQPISTLKAGERVKMKVAVQALQQAEYVMIEIPIPAGCILVNKSASGYREYFKNKVVIFQELLGKGNHSFEIDLECRYAGNYTLNPAKATLMYFPTFFGRNKMKTIRMQ